MRSRQLIRKCYGHPALAGLTQDQRQELWHAYRAKHPNYKWSTSYMIQWLLWVGAWFLIAHWISLYFSPEFVSRPGAHAILTLGIGAFGGVIIIGKWMLPIRYRHFHDYLDSLTRIFHDSRGRGAGILDVAKADAENAVRAELTLCPTVFFKENAGNIGKDKSQTEVS